ncbi:hypothetical protein HDU77_011123, partial [Chytriomyces hyalinus]
MGPPKQRGRPTKIDQYVGLPAAKRVAKRQAAGSAEIEFDEDEFLTWMRRDPHPSDHVPPAPQARTQQSEPQSQHPAPSDELLDEPADEPAFCVTDAFDEPVVDNPSDTDTDTGEDYEFRTVGADGLLTDAPSRHHQRERQKFVDFNNHKAGMLAEYAKLVTANLTGCICS